MTTELKLGWPGWGNKRKLSFLEIISKNPSHHLPIIGGKRQCYTKNYFRIFFFFFSNERQREHQQKLSAIKKPLKNSQWFFSFLSLLALNYLLNDLAWFFFFFSYQWHTPVAWRSNFWKGKICMAYIQQAASKPIHSKTCNWIPKAKMTGEPPRKLPAPFPKSIPGHEELHTSLLLLIHFPVVFSPGPSILWKWELEFAHWCYCIVLL